MCAWRGWEGGTRLVFNAEKRKGNPRCFPPCPLLFSEVECQHTEGRRAHLSTNKRGFVWDVVATSVRTKSRLHSTSTGPELRLLRGARWWTSGATRPGGPITMGRSLRSNVASFIRTQTSVSAGCWRGLHLLGLNSAQSGRIAVITKQVQRFEGGTLFKYPNQSHL